MTVSSIWNNLTGKTRATGKALTSTVTNNYVQLVEQLKKLSPDWRPDRVGVGAEVYRNPWELRAFSRSLWRENPYIIGYGQELSANVIGPFGFTLRMKVKEEADRTIYTTSEKTALRNEQLRRERVADFLRSKGGTANFQCKFIKETKNKATIKVGMPDVFANQIIERAYKDFQRKENYCVTGRLTGDQSDALALKSAARDGEHFIRFVYDRSYKYGVKIQHINSEWCNYYLTCKNEETGNPIRYGIEYDDSGAAPVPVAYHFIKATAAQWQTFMPMNFMGGDNKHLRVDAADVIHYAKWDDDCDVTRPVPWATPVMSSSRQLTKWMEAAVVSARMGACSNVFFEAALNGPDGISVASVDPEIMKKLSMEMNPGGMHGLPPGVTAKVVNPNNPNPATGSFRNESLREICAGLPAAQFSTIGQNYAEINFSAGRLERLTITAQFMMLQEMHISILRIPVFERFLKSALIVQAIPLPLEKFNKFNKPKFTGRRWEGVDPIKEANANAIRLANKFTSLQRIHDEQGTDLEEILFEIAEANMLMEQFGITTQTTQGPMSENETEEPEEDDKTEEE